jgi:hypothetical protein
VKQKGEILMQEVEIDSTDIALALIDMLYDQGTIDAHLYNRIKAKNKAVVKSDES